MNETHFANYFTDKDLWLMATQYGAEVAAVDDALGSLRPGLVADISVFKNRGGSAYNDVIILVQDIVQSCVAVSGSTAKLMHLVAG